MKEEDLQIEAVTYGRYGDHGGQHVGSFSPGVKVTHIPTSISAFCDFERSQLRNKKVAVAMLEYGLAELGWKE